MEALTPGAWMADWSWGLPLIVLASTIHVIGLGTIEIGIDSGLKHRHVWRSPRVTFAIVVGATVLAATVLHAIAAIVWAVAYVWLGALPDGRAAMLYSIGAMTTFGHANLRLASEWQMLGALEALNGMLLFGLTTAFLYATLQNVRAVILREHGAIRR
ncbi:MAG: hypothetical protein KF735_02820 [Chelatococcus sp.]|jgi:hypothetical protein|uniref:hypothetical protein n=1 Tax=unclassified Chelatococcus TaxID=2638111 RepID=UPI001BD1961C|nr:MULTISPECIES: hypothetical protein [unclassified Chelatococcus]CAH1668994.1 conserved membrane hypothetical protein [Hyphomicrobiales bacterium]MBS7739393.1 hypothetical protein [Chelatococcus sp. HY11]MBX3536548.1 hypothetical protein [Chelatococcus sp.]MBX3543762.1 hypothetical protein [Chelatococcus sp.]MCO5076072.1 hypothetical protein [Chelatococcus sp.]